MSHVYCPECGFQNPEAANYCAKCGALLVREEGDETTQTFSAEEADEALGRSTTSASRAGARRPLRRRPLGRELRPAGRAHDDRALAGLRRVPRRRHRLAPHAVLVQRASRWYIEDQGSLNGTFVNRRRVESAELDDGDELQIGKYRLTFLQR